MSELGRYRLVRRLGQGGQAEVFEGVLEADGGFRRHVAVKTLLPELRDDPVAVRMFLDEAHLGSRLTHPNLISVLDFGQANGTPYQILELVDGADLERLLRRAEERGQGLDPTLALFVAREVARGLHAAHGARDEAGHSLKLVHRDVSPSNVLLARSGAVRLGDFGVAFARGRRERTEGAVVKGKLAYMAPEQATRGAVDLRSDVFALGCVLHRLVCGASPIADLSDLTALALGTELSLDVRLEPGLRAVLARALAARASQRYASAAELADALTALPAVALCPNPGAALGAWVSALLDDARSAHQAAPTPLLDGLLGLGSMPASELSGSAGDSRAMGAQPPSSPVQRPPAPAKRTRFRAAWMALPIVLGVGFWTSFRRPRPVEPTRSTTAEPRSVKHVLDVAQQTSTEVAAADVDDVQPSDPNPSRAPAAPVRNAARATPQRAKNASRHDTGTLVIGGPGAQRAALRIDGKRAGFAPKRLALQAGTHVITLTREHGPELVRKIELGPEHTDSAPLRWLVP